jgi:hypothetical protein
VQCARRNAGRSPSFAKAIYTASGLALPTPGNGVYELCLRIM